MANYTMVHRWALAAALILGSGVPVSAQTGTEGQPYDPGPKAPSKIEIAGPNETGQRLVVTGQVFQADGVTPAPGVVLYVYQTDHTGLYNSNSSLPPRLRGWMKTDSQGGYEYRTVRPAPYPGGQVAAHVHTQLWGGGVPSQWNTELLFADDPRVSERDRRGSTEAGSFAWVCTPKVSEGVARCVHNLRLKKDGDRLEDNIRHGLAGPETGPR